MLKQNEPAQWFYTETKDIKTMEFNFQDKQSPLPYVRALTPRMIVSHDFNSILCHTNIN